MAKYLIGWGVAAGYGGINEWAIVEHDSLEDAQNDAYERSYQDCEGTLDYEDIDSNDDEAMQEETESWVDYEAFLLEDVPDEDKWKIEDAKRNCEGFED